MTIAKGLVVWDWNGTIQDDLHHIYECGVQRIFAHFGLPCPTLEQYRHSVKPDFMKSFYWPNGISREVTADQLNAIMREGFKQKGSPPELFEDAAETVLELAVRGYEQMVASGFATAKLLDAVGRSGLEEHFTLVIGDVKDKIAAVSTCIGHASVASRIAVVGDTVEDLESAHANDATPYICPRGFHPLDRIEAERKNMPTLVVIPTLRDLLVHLD